MWYINTMEYTRPQKEQNHVLFTATWVWLEVVMLCELMQTQKTTYHLLSLKNESWGRAQWFTPVIPAL